MHFSRKDQHQLLASALELTGSSGWRSDAVAFSAVQDDAVIAIGVFQAFAGGDAEFHFAMVGHRRMRKSIVEGFMLLAFGEANFVNRVFPERGDPVSRLWAQIDAGNVVAQAAALKAGFAFEYRKRAGISSGNDAILFSMTRADCLARTPAAATGNTDDTADGEG